MLPRPDLTLEQEWAAHGLVCGVDEAGRGPWAGPVSAAAIILDPHHLPEGLNDSKLLSEAAREIAEADIKARALCWSVAFATVEEIDRLNILREVDEVSRQRFERMERETRDLQRQLQAELDAIAAEREAFEKMRDAFETRRAEIAELEHSKQFKRALQLYESSKSDVAANMFQSLIDRGNEEDVVSYLNAMKPMSAKKIIEEFEQRDPALAARLLEGVRTYGLSTNE